MVAPGLPSTERGYFRFGPDLTLYGSLASGRLSADPAEALWDALKGVESAGSTLALPFDPGEVVENLYRERYAPGYHGDGGRAGKLVRRAYYFVRPLLPVALRKHLQRARLRNRLRLPFPAWPVDCTVERFHQRLLALSLKLEPAGEAPFIWFWPDGLPACAVMTHDIETSAGRDFCRELMDANASFGISSSFQIVPEQRYAVPAAFRKMIEERGFEVNVHDLNHDGLLFAERAEFLRRAGRINRYAGEFGALGFRSAALYRNTDWFDQLDFAYDMSVPNVGHLDNQRGGCCTVMPYFIGNLLELPLTTIQDYTLFHILNEYSSDLWKAQVAIIMQEHGLASFIAHPDYLIPRRAMRIYIELLEHLSRLRDEGKLWVPLPREAAAWWRQRSRMTLEYANGAWRVQGEGSDRARIAYAYVDGDSVRYRVSAGSAVPARRPVTTQASGRT